MLEAPAGFAGEYLTTWRATVAELEAVGTLDAAPADVVEVYVRNLVRMRAAEAHVAEHGSIVAAPRTGLPVENPHLSVANTAGRMVAKLAADLGLMKSRRPAAKPAGIDRDLASLDGDLAADLERMGMRH